MQDTLLQAFVIALGLLMNPSSDPFTEDWDDAFTAGMQEREEALSREKEKLHQEVPLNDHRELQDEKTAAEQNMDVESTLSHDKIQECTNEMKFKTNGIDVQTQDHEDAIEIQAEKPTPETFEADDYIWIIWKTFSLISLIKFVWKCRLRNKKSNATKAFLNMSEYMPSVDSRTLQDFHSHCVQSDSGDKEEFLDGFVGDLLQAIQKVCSENGGMAFGTVDMEDLHHVIVPLVPPEPYLFKCFYRNKADNIIGGHIELVKNAQIQNGCSCQTSDAADEMVCLLHKGFNNLCTTLETLFCKEGSKLLSKAKVSKWFRSTLRRAWSSIAFKYEFEVCISNKTPGAVIVRFRSGEKINFMVNPVIPYDSHSFFFIALSPKSVDTFWSLSLSQYEKIFLNQISKSLPINSCHMQTLEILLFLHKRQIMLTGSTALEDLHFKMALMHLLLTKNKSEWRPALLANRLQDVFNFMMHSLKTKQLHHVLVGNPGVRGIIQLTPELVQSAPVNLFHPLLVHECIYKNTRTHFQELLRNAQIVINEYLGANTPERDRVRKSGLFENLILSGKAK